MDDFLRSFEKHICVGANRNPVNPVDLEALEK